MSSNLLELDGLNKAFGGNQVITSLTLKLEEGHVSSLVGPNGAGKTTIFNLITGFVSPDSGRVRYAGKDVTGSSPQDLKERGLVRTFQNLRLFLDMTVFENVLVSLERMLRGRARARLERVRTKEVLTRVGLWEVRDVKASELSYAEKKFLSIARAMASGARCLLLDEPASGLDGPSRTLFHELMREFKANGQTVLLIEHNLDIVREVSDSIVFLDRGNIVASGTAEEIFSDPELSERYFGV